MAVMDKYDILEVTIGGVCSKSIPRCFKIERIFTNF